MHDGYFTHKANRRLRSIINPWVIGCLVEKTGLKMKMYFPGSNLSYFFIVQMGCLPSILWNKWLAYNKWSQTLVVAKGGVSLKSVELDYVPAEELALVLKCTSDCTCRAIRFFTKYIFTSVTLDKVYLLKGISVYIFPLVPVVSSVKLRIVPLQ